MLSSNKLLQVNKALDNEVYLVIVKGYFCLFFIRTYVVGTHWNCFIVVIFMRTHKISFIKNKQNYSSIIINCSSLSSCNDFVHLFILMKI